MTSRSELVAVLERLVRERPGLTTNELVIAVEQAGFEIPMNGGGTAIRQKANTVVSRLNGLQQQKKIYSHKRSGKTENYWYHGQNSLNTKLVASLGSYQSVESAQAAIDDYPDDVPYEPIPKPEPAKEMSVASSVGVHAEIKPRAPDWDYAKQNPELTSKPKHREGMVRLTLEVRAEQAELIAGVLGLLATEFATAEVVTE